MSLRGCEAPVAIRNTLCSFSLLSPAACFSSSFLFLCLRRHTFCQQQQKAFTVVSTGFQPRCGVKIGTLPRNHLASFATGGASAVSAKNQWFLDFLSLQELRSLWDVVGIDSAADPLPLPLRRRKYYVYRRGIRIPTTSLRTVCTVVSRFPTTLWRENRGPSSKPPRCIRHRRRFGGFLGMTVRLGR